MSGIKLFQHKYPEKNFSLRRVLAAVALVSVVITIINAWQMWNEHTRFEEIANKHIAVTSNIASIMLYDEVLTMSARLCAATGDFTLEERYNKFDLKLTTAINEVREMLPLPAIESFANETDGANTALVKIERQAFALTHQGRGQEALALLTSDEYAGLKKIYADGMQKTISATHKLIQSDIDNLNQLSFRSIGTNILGILILFFVWFFAARSTRIWARAREHSEDMLRKARAELEVRVDQRTADLLSTNELLQSEIYERKRAEEDLRESQEYARILFSSSHIPLIVMDAETGIYVDCNSAAVEIYGYSTREEVIGKTPLDVSAPIQYNGTDAATEVIRHSQVCRENGSHVFEWRHLRPSGQIWDADVHLMLFQYRGKHFMQFTLQDITERKKADQALRESETKFRTLFESATDSIFLMEQDIFVDCNRKTLEMFGCSREQIIGHTPFMFSPEVQPDGRNSMAYSQEIIHAALRGQPQFFEWQHCRYDRTLFDAEVSLNLFNAADKNYLQVLVHDVSERKNTQEKMQYLAMHDSLTGLPNRSMFTQLLNRSIQSAKRHKRQLAVFFIDLDRFKIINDTKGHDAGDQLLQEIAARYKQSLRASDVVSRQGGDEFVILIDDFNNLSDLETVAGNILASTLRPILLTGDECRVTASIGISIYPKDGEDEQSLMKNADMAMYFAKEEGKNNFQFYSTDIHLQSMERWAIESNLRLALELEEFSLHYQAKVNFKTGAITGVEALLRWQNKNLGSVAPTQFIPVAEETGMIISIGKWVLKTACAQNVAWQQHGLPKICMAVNLSLRQLTDNNLINDIKTALSDSGMAPNLLELEITESMIMSNPKKMVDVLSIIKSMGVRLAIDDFGTGYSSLAQLKHFPVNTLKIDRSFIRNIPGNAEDTAITHAIITMGESLGLTIVAEGVETTEQMNYLKEHCCDEMQGYFFSRPVEPELFAELLRKQILTI